MTVLELLGERRRSQRRPMEGCFAVLLEDLFGKVRLSLISAVNASDHGIAFRAECEFSIGQTLVITDGEDVIEVVVRSERANAEGLIYGAKVVRSGELPTKFANKVPTFSSRLAKGIDLKTARVPYKQQCEK